MQAGAQANYIKPQISSRASLIRPNWQLDRSGGEWVDLAAAAAAAQGGLNLNSPTIAYQSSALVACWRHKGRQHKDIKTKSVPFGEELRSTRWRTIKSALGVTDRSGAQLHLRARSPSALAGGDVKF